jgi:hypothetical protein
MEDIYEVVCWPESQMLMEKPMFRENSSLINDEPLLSDYGSSAYFVRKSWLEKNKI